MTFRFNHFNYSERDEGRVLVCTHAETNYFTEGKRYPIYVNPANKQPYILDDEGDDIIESSSEFDFHLASLPPKQPKVGEVWSFTQHQQHYVYHEETLYYITKIEDGRVYHQLCNTEKYNNLWSGYTFSATVEHFLARHIFVF